MSSEWTFFWVSMPALALMFISWLGFARLTMARIEKQLKAEGKPRPCPWDGPGGRVVLYAYVIVLPENLAKRIHTRLIDAPLVRSYALPKDRWLAITLVVSGNVMIFLGFWGSYYLGFY